MAKESGYTEHTSSGRIGTGGRKWLNLIADFEKTTSKITEKATRLV